MTDKKLRVNYIQHLIAFFNRCDADSGIGSTHIYLYLTLFRLWNANRFKNPIRIVRSRTMAMGKVKARSTYHSAIWTLHERGYIRYRPSGSAFESSEVEMIPFDTPDAEKVFASTEPTSEPDILPKENSIQPMQEGDTERVRNSVRPVPKISTGSVRNSVQSVPKIGAQPVQKSVPIIKQVNNKSIETGEKETRAHDDGLLAKEVNAGGTANATMKNKPACISDAEKFFEKNGGARGDGARFYRYYEGIGWTVGGHSPITDWEAVALNWIDGASRFTREAKPAPRGLHTTTDKDYDKPL